MTEAQQQAIQNLIASQAAGSIYNADFTEWKFRAGRAFENAVNTDLREPFFNGGGYQQRSKIEREVDDAILYTSLVQFPSKKLLKTLDKAEDTPYILAVRTFIETWKPLADTIRALKPMTIKGRKPSTEPRKTPERTLDNTGTCAVCGQNVKLKGGRIVHHGFQVRWHQRMGSCYGVRRLPIEVSPEGAQAYLDNILVPGLVEAKKAVAVWDANPPKTLDERMQHSRVTSQVRWMTQDIARLEKAIAEWKPTPLPGDK